MKEIKLLTFVQYYAPNNVVGAFRHLKLSKYLDKHNIKQYIFTSEYNKDINVELIKDIPISARVFRKKMSIYETNILKATKTKPTYLNMLMYIPKDLLFSPDKFVWWAISRLPEIIKTIRNEKIDIVMVSGSPFSFFIIGLIVKKLCNVKLVLDYRDPWKHCPFVSQSHFIRKALISFWEKVCVKNADLITVCTDSMLCYINDNYQNKAKVIKLVNGFDYDDFKQIRTQNNADSESYTFLYSGTYKLDSNVYNPVQLVTAFNEFLKEHNISDCKLILIGLTNASTQKYINDLRNENIISLGLKPKHEAFKLMGKADVLVHFYYPSSITDTVSLKICEYALFKKPIVSFNKKDSDLAHFLKVKQLGETADTNNVVDMKALFNKAYKRKIKTTDTPLDTLKDYNIDHTATMLAKELRKLL
jgi:hypothetical protein